MVRRRLLSGALLLVLALSSAQASAATKPHPPSKPGLLLGSHPGAPAKNARLALMKTRSTAVPLNSPKPGKIVNSLNRRAGKTVTIHRTLPK
jgi:hypothetical protein